MIRVNVEKARIGRVALFVLMGSLGFAADKADNPAATYSGTANVRFYGTSTLHNFEGQVTSRPFKLRISDDGRWSAEADVSVATMNTNNQRRDKNMYEMFSAASFPSIHGSVQNVLIPKGGARVVEGKLKIRNVERKVPVTISGWTQDADGVSFHGETIVSLREFGLKAPSVMGLVRVGDAVRLRADVTARPERSQKKTTSAKGADE